MLRRVVISLIMILALSLAIGPNIKSSNAQTDSIESSGQTTLSGDLLNNPLAHDILEKIEQTKKWIADLEKREYERTQAQQELEEKRAVALERLNQDLLEWENLWSNYTSRAAFERFVEDKPPQIQGVFWDQFEFKEMKVTAGREALKEVIANGGSLSEARAAYHKAAETKRIELIEMNAQFNVKHNLAYYNQQLLFNSTGQLPQNPFTQSQLADYYTDYRSDPEYLLANPNDKHAYESLETNPNTQCRDGYVVVHRLQTDDYACITESTAEMWEMRGMGKIVDSTIVIFDEKSLTPSIKTNPGTQCISGHTVVYHNEAEEYACVLDSTAETWIEEGTAEIHELTQFILDKDQQKKIENQVFELNQEINDLYDIHDLDQIQLKKKYDQIYKEADEFTKQEEKNLLVKFYSEDNMSKNELAIQIMQVRQNNESKKEQILEDKSQALEDLNTAMHKKMQKMTSEFNNNSNIKMNWNSDDSKYYAEKR
jgi:hypothetical protein